MNEAINQMQQMELDEIEEIITKLQAEDGQDDDIRETKERFRVRDLEQLNWAFRKMAALSAQQKRVDMLRDAELRRINEWHAKESKGVSESMKFFEMLVSEYAEEQRAIDPKYKSEKTPYGAVAFKKQQPAWEFPDEAAAVKWLKANGYEEALVKVTEAISNKTEFKKIAAIKNNVFVHNGEVMDTADLTPLPESIQYLFRENGEIIDKTTGEIAEGVTFHETVVTDSMTGKVVPGVVATERPDKIDIKAEL